MTTLIVTGVFCFVAGVVIAIIALDRFCGMLDRIDDELRKNMD